MRKEKLIKGAITNGFIIGIINVGIQYFLLKDSATIAISVYSITNAADTVLGKAVFLAITLALITTVISYSKAAFFPNDLG